MNGDEAFRTIQALARSNAAKTGRGAPTQDYLIRHALESFLDRLSRSTYRDSFVLKGGILLAAYDVRRSTRDADIYASGTDITPSNMMLVTQNITGLDIADGVQFDTNRIEIQHIREGSTYPGLRVRIATSIGPWSSTTLLDVSTGDPVVPNPKVIQLERILGSPIQLRGYAPETIIAEKGVTILERGITRTRWRDYLDIVQLASNGIDRDILLRSAREVASFRKVHLQPIAGVTSGYGEIAQTRWAAWRRKEHLESLCEENLDDQMRLIAMILDPVFESDSTDDGID